MGYFVSSILLDKTNGDALTWQDIILEGLEVAMSALFIKKAKAMLQEITGCLGDRETGDILIADFSNFESLKYTNGALV